MVSYDRSINLSKYMDKINVWKIQYINSSKKYELNGALIFT